VKLISDSSAFGFVFRCHFKKNPEKSPYFYLNSKGETQDVVYIALKCILVNDRIKNANDDDNHFWYYQRLNTEKKSKRHFEVKDRFLQEVRIQVDVSKSGLKAMNRNSPIALYSKLWGDRSLAGKIFIRMLSRRCITKECRNALSKMLDELSFRQNVHAHEGSVRYYLGILAMEYIDPQYSVYSDIVKPIILDDIVKRPGNEDICRYDSLALSPFSERLRWIYNTARYDVLRMAIDTGYSQGDYHTDNMLLNEGIRRTILLDFGKSKKIVDYEAMIKLWKNSTTDTVSWREQPSDLRTMLKIIFHTTFQDNKKHDEFVWLKNIDERDIEILTFLHISRTAHLENRGVDKIMEIMGDFEACVFNGVCTVDNRSRIYKGSTLWSNILEYTIYGVFHKYFNCREPT
jgi:hypothetical protein